MVAHSRLLLQLTHVSETRWIWDGGGSRLRNKTQLWRPSVTPIASPSNARNPFAVQTLPTTSKCSDFSIFPRRHSPSCGPPRQASAWSFQRAARHSNKKFLAACCHASQRIHRRRPFCWASYRLSEVLFARAICQWCGWTRHTEKCVAHWSSLCLTLPSALVIVAASCTCSFSASRWISNTLKIRLLPIRSAGSGTWPVVSK